jgi:hypothetical protein
MATWSVMQWATARRDLNIDVSLYPRLKSYWLNRPRRDDQRPSHIAN